MRRCESPARSRASFVAPRSRKLKAVATRQYEHGAKLIDELGRQIGGWFRSTGQSSAKHMKRLGGIWPKLVSFENLLRAYRKARAR